MGKTTGISWTDSTWNPFVGCRKVSQGCAHCYMFRDQEKFGNNPMLIRRTSPATFNAPLKWKESARVFTCSWSDFFIEDADEWRAEAWDIIRRTPHLTYQILTKRPENILDRLPEDWGDGYPNVWMGVSVENQATADERIPALLNTPAAVRFVSYEPALEPVDFKSFQPFSMRLDEPGSAASVLGILSGALGWIIVGCESGPNRRRMELHWAGDVIQQGAAAGVPVFVKQLPINELVSHDPAEWPEALRSREFPND